MRTLYIECNMGAAGDMLMAALLELHPHPQEFVKRLSQLGIPNVKIQRESMKKCGITGTHVKITVNGIEEESLDASHEHHHEPKYQHKHHHEPEYQHEHHHEPEYQHKQHHHESGHHHTSLHEIDEIIEELPIDVQVKEDAKQVYRLIAEAESQAHGQTVEEIHFHEVGTMDAVADIVGVCMLVQELGVDRIVASPVHVGSGHVHCAHGVLPVPAPAAAYILRDVPIYGGKIAGELCTPTGAALLKHFAVEFGDMPVMRVEKIGYGMGKKDFPMANCVRVMLGTEEQKMDTIVELCCNLDDMTPEQLGFATELLLQEGALDVYTTSIQMKKNRPGVILTCMCKSDEKEKFLHLIFKYTTTLGIREYKCNRYGLSRVLTEKTTELGTIHEKTAEGYGVVRKKIEYEDLAKIAREQKLSIEQVLERIQK